MADRLKSRIAGRDEEGHGPEVLLVDPAAPQRRTWSYSEADRAQVQAAVEAAAAALGSWRRTDAGTRSEILSEAARWLSDRAADVAFDIVREMGKTIREARSEVQAAVRSLRYFAGQAMAPVGQMLPRSTRAGRIWCERVPVGVVGCITPWNFPLLIPAYKVAPAIAFGNTVVLKPAEQTPHSAVLLADALEAAGLPPGVVNVCLGGPATGAALTDSPVDAISFTGSGEVGRSIARSIAGSDTRLQLEMGGKNASLVLDGADIDRAASLIADGAMGMAGQRCTATSRVIAADPAYDAIADRLIDRVGRLRLGDPRLHETDVGPLVSALQQVKVLSAVSAGEDAARRLGGVSDCPEEGFYVPPVVFGDVDPESPLAQEEIFGPVLALIRVAGFDDAISVANGTRYGLTASVFTRDLGMAMAAAEVLDVGVVHVNSQGPFIERYAPFGGTRGSGFGGREQGEAAREFYTEWKSVYVAWEEIE